MEGAFCLPDANGFANGSSFTRLATGSRSLCVGYSERHTNGDVSRPRRLQLTVGA